MTSTRPGGDAFRLFSLALRVTGRPCLVVGGGAVAARKVAALLEAGALVEVVAPELGPELAAQRREGASWRWMAKPFSAADVVGCLLVIAATDDRQVNRRVAEAAREQRALVNVVDDPDESDFFVPSVLRRGPLHFAVTTSGLAPAVSARLRRRLEELFPEEWGDAVALIGRARGGGPRRRAGRDRTPRPGPRALRTGHRRSARRGRPFPSRGSGAVMHVAVLGVNHKTACIEVREQVALDDDGCRALTRELARRPGVSEVVAVSTCNRTELYLSGPQLPLDDVAVEGLCRATDACRSDLVDSVYYLEDRRPSGTSSRWRAPWIRWSWARPRSSIS